MTSTEELSVGVDWKMDEDQMEKKTQEAVKKNKKLETRVEVHLLAGQSN